MATVLASPTRLPSSTPRAKCSSAPDRSPQPSRAQAKLQRMTLSATTSRSGTGQGDTMATRWSRASG